MVKWTDYIWSYFFELIYRRTGQSNLKKIAANFHNLEEWQARTSIIRQGIWQGAGLFPLPEKTPLNPVFHSYREHNGYSVENVYFESVPGFFVTGNLYRPLDQPRGELIPVVLAPHGHFKRGRMNEDNQNLCATLARMGAVAFTWDMVGREESTQVPHNSRHTLAFHIWNSMRAMDFVLGLDNIDGTRVGVTGASGGGTQTMHLTAIDDRVTLSMPCVMVSAGFYGSCICESGLPIHKGPNYKTNNAELAAMGAPRPLLIISAGSDWTRLVPVREYPFIRTVYNMFGATDMVENAHFPKESHGYGAPERQAAYKFVAKHFLLPGDGMLTPEGTFDETPNVMETDAQQHAFSEEYPRPSNALVGEQAVLQVIQKLQK
jgi:dienelactone hydrolase